MSAVRWVVEGADGVLPAAARQQLEDILASYDRGIAELDQTEQGRREGGAAPRTYSLWAASGG